MVIKKMHPAHHRAVRGSWFEGSNFHGKVSLYIVIQYNLSGFSPKTRCLPFYYGNFAMFNVIQHIPLMSGKLGPAFRDITP